MSYRETLLDQPSLEPHEVGDLYDWLAMLESDCRQFGETREDRVRMDRIRAKLWVAGNQLVRQRNGGVAHSNEGLLREWTGWDSKRQQREFDQLITHLTIQQAAMVAATTGNN